MAVGSAMASQFSKDGAYYAHLSVDGKLQIWNTGSGVREQEYVPNFHLASPCTCLQFIEKNADSVKNGSPKKKLKRRESQELHSTCIALGTTRGSLLMYSVAKADLEFKIENSSVQNVTCLSWDKDGLLYSGVGQNIVVWDLDNKKIKQKWKAGDNDVSSVLILPDEEKLLSASKYIKLWNVAQQEVLKTFVGHSSEVAFMCYINPKQSKGGYLVSATKGDRIINCWTLNEAISDKTPVASFLMEDTCNGLTVNVDSEGITSLTAVTRSGIAHIYRHTLNGKCNKPLKPKSTVQVVSDTGQNDTVPVPVSVVNAVLLDQSTLLIGYGNLLVLTFERMTVDVNKKVQCLIRKDPRVPTHSKKGDVTKTFTPLVDNNVHYLTPYTSDSTPVKRKADNRIEVPMEKRLENLQLNKSTGSNQVPKVDTVAQLLMQGLRSNDRNILKTVLHKKDAQTIKNTVKRLPIAVIGMLVKELTILIQGKMALSQIGAMWLKGLLEVHAGLLISNPELAEMVNPLLGSIETRLTLQTPLSRLKGRLNLLVSQISTINNQEICSEEPLLSFNDKASDHSENDIMDITQHSDSDHEWVEENSDESDTVDGESGSDVEMGT